VIALRVVETDDDYESWRQVRMAVVPGERTQSVEEMRRGATPDRLLLVAELHGAVVGAGMAGPSDLAGAAAVLPRVVPAARRVGVGTALLRALAEHAASLGPAVVNSRVDDSGSLAFAERFGFREIDRDVEQVRTLGEEAAPELPAGIEIVAVDGRPELWRAAYDVVATQAFQDMALVSPVVATVEQWERDWLTAPEATFVALAGGEVIGCAGLSPDGDEPYRAEHTLTAVRRDWRGGGVATALKRTTLAWAAANGIREVYTWTQRGNENMRRLNEHLGYVTRSESITVRTSLPLTV
jgi:mycothiol synthase